MQRALYGRMRLGRCLSRDYYVGCAADVTAELDAKCSGKQHCRVQLPDHTLLKALACPSDLVAYLEAEYTCIAGELFHVTRLHFHLNLLRTVRSSTYYARMQQIRITQRDCISNEI